MSETLSQMRYRADFDQKLSHGACRLLSCLINDRYYKNPNAEFPLTWKTVQRWLGLNEDQCYRLMRELQQRGYLKHEGVRHCPPTSYFIFALNSRKKAGIESGKKEGLNSRKNAGNHKYNSLREESLKKEGALVPLSTVLKEARNAVERGG